MKRNRYYKQMGVAVTCRSYAEYTAMFCLTEELPLLAIAGFMYALRFLLVFSLSDPLWIALTQLMHSITFGIFLFTAIRYMEQLVPDQYRATGQAIFNVVWSGLAGLTSGQMGGLLYDQISARAVFMAASALAFCAAIGFLATHLLQRDNLARRRPGRTARHQG